MRPFVTGVVCLLLALRLPDIHSKLEEKFTKCREVFFHKNLFYYPVIPGILENSEPQAYRYQVICQKYKDKIRYATLYDTTNRIPVFSAYKYTGTTKFKPPQIPWMIELQLESSSSSEMNLPFVKQARNQDYWIKNAYNFSTGALFPISHTADRQTAESTFTLTNSVPQKSDFKGIWNLVENNMKEYMDNNCRDGRNRTAAYVLTGVVPGNIMLNERVNIPSHVWTAFCCCNSSSCVSKAYYTENGHHENVNNIRLKDLKDVQSFLKDHFRVKKDVQLFNNNCE